VRAPNDLARDFVPIIVARHRLARYEAAR
jgi:hypothetical protein